MRMPKRWNPYYWMFESIELKREQDEESEVLRKLNLMLFRLELARAALEMHDSANPTD